MDRSNTVNELKPTIEKLFNALDNKNDSEILDCYESTVLLLKNQYFVKKHWPTDKEIGDDKFLRLLCKELRQRHAYTHNASLLNQDHECAFENCRTLFDLIANSSPPVQFKLPDDWLWQIIDTFVSRYIQVNGCVDARNTFSDIYGKFLPNSSNIDSKSVLRTVYNFSLVEMLRLHSLCGDYNRAIELLESNNIPKKDQSTPKQAFEVLTFYYAGFSYMMLSRYKDAINAFTSVLVTIPENNSLYIKWSYQNEQINKLIQKMYRLIVICFAANPMPTDSSISKSLREKDYVDSLFKMLYENDWNEFEVFFKLGRPKHIIDEASTDFKQQIEQHFSSLHSRRDAETQISQIYQTSPDIPNSRNGAIRGTCNKACILVAVVLITLIYFVFFAISLICLLARVQFMVDFYEKYSVLYYWFICGLFAMIMLCACFCANVNKHG